MVNYDDLLDELATFEFDPLGFVRWAFPWGEPGPLKDERLEDWQYEFLDTLGKLLREGYALYDAMDEARNVIPPVLMGAGTGHGVGKSALAAMLTWWAMSTMPDTKGVVTANTETQLKTKTWPEIAKWHRMFIAKDLFDVTATAIFPKDELHARTWRIDIVPWSKHNTEAFAGLHNSWRRIFILFDEASAIEDVIHEVTEGALTDAHTQIVWIQFGNPTKNTGRFREIAPDGRFGHRWNFRAVDSRTVRRTNKDKIQEWIEDYGEDSDFVRVRVLGRFPRQDAVSFIPYELAKEAAGRPLPEINEYEVVLGVDVARYGDNLSCIYPRRGRDARSIPPRFFQNVSTIQLAFHVRDAIFDLNPVAVFVDETGVGGGVVDRLIEMRLACAIIGVSFGGKPDGLADEKVANKRAEIWLLLRQWLATGCIPEHLRGLECSFVDELTSPTYGFNNRDEILLESKKDMRLRGKPSPDASDALACTFAMPMIPPRVDRYGRIVTPKQADYEYNPLELL